MKSAPRTSRIALSGLMLMALAGCYGPGYVAVRHVRSYHSYPYHNSYYSAYPGYGSRYDSGSYYRPYSYRYYSGGPSLNLSYTRTTYRSPGYVYRSTPSYSTAPRSSSMAYVATSPRYHAGAVRVSTARSASANAGKAHGKGHAKHKGPKQ